MYVTTHIWTGTDKVTNNWIVLLTRRALEVFDGNIRDSQVARILVA